jgi:hypothetical protein
MINFAGAKAAASCKNAETLAVPSPVTRRVPIELSTAIDELLVLWAWAPPDSPVTMAELLREAGKKSV